MFCFCRPLRSGFLLVGGKLRPDRGAGLANIPVAVFVLVDQRIDAVPALDFGKGQRLVGKQREKAVNVPARCKHQKRRGKLCHVVGFVRAVGAVLTFHFGNDALRFGFNQPVAQGGDMRLEVPRRKLLTAAPFLLQKIAQGFGVVWLHLKAEKRAILRIGWLRSPRS